MKFLARRRRDPTPDRRHTGEPTVPQQPVAEEPPAPPPVPRTDLTRLLGQNLHEPRARQVVREWALQPGPGDEPPRGFRSPEYGVELTVDELGTVTLICLHFSDGDDFRPYPGAIPGRGGTIARRGSLWAALGRPARSTDPYRDRHLTDHGPADEWEFPTFRMRAQYALDDETLLRLTLDTA